MWSPWWWVLINMPTGAAVTADRGAERARAVLGRGRVDRCTAASHDEPGVVDVPGAVGLDVGEDAVPGRSP